MSDFFSTMVEMQRDMLRAQKAQMDAAQKMLGAGKQVAKLQEAGQKVAEANLAAFGNVRVLAGNGATIPFDTADVIYVNAGVTRPADAWLDLPAEGGRLILPLTGA